MEDRPLSYKEKNQDFERLRQEVEANPHPIGLLLDQIELPRNLGSLYRIADAARLEKIYGYQMDNMEKGKKVKRVARNSNEFVPYQNIQNVEVIQQLKSNYTIYALEITQQSIPYTELKPKFPCLLLVGNEKRGVSKELLNLADQSIHIPMHGINLSMNVAVATAIATYKLLEHI